MPRDVHVCSTDLVACGQIGQGQWHTFVARHQVQHAFVKAAHGMAQQPTQMVLPPTVIVQSTVHHGPWSRNFDHL